MLEKNNLIINQSNFVCIELFRVRMQHKVLYTLNDLTTFHQHHHHLKTQYQRNRPPPLLPFPETMSKKDKKNIKTDKNRLLRLIGLDLIV